MSDLIVTCNSIDSVVEYKSEHGLLCTLKWEMHRDNICGFHIQNADILMDVYRASFYMLDHAAIVQFIMNVALHIMKDQKIDNVIFMNMEGEAKDIPYFLPHTIESDEEVVRLPHTQIAIVQLWGEYILNFRGYLCTDLIDAADERDILEAFLDLINAELSLLMDVNTGDSNNE